MSVRLTKWAVLLAGLPLLFGGIAEAQTAVRSPRPPDAFLYFIDLADGARIPQTSTIRFGLRNIGVAPAGVAQANTGHHHLLVDTDLPPLDRPIPNDFKHLHFGAGQTEAEITLTPGEHTLQLLLADHNHVPHDPPIVSPRIRVVVTGEESAPTGFRRKPSPKDARVYFTYPRDGARVPPEFVVRFNLRGMGVAPAGVAQANTGHHHLLIDTPAPPFERPIPNDFKHLHFGAGQTETKVTLPPGRHTLQLLLADENHVPHDPPVISERIEVVVVSSRRRARRR
jgi:hypothetical protein